MVRKISFGLLSGIILCIYSGVSVQKRPENISGVWIADNSNGTYKNPFLYSDFSDPDVVRPDSDYYMTASSFNCVPWFPILHSRDLVNWELIAYTLPLLIPEEVFDKPQHGNGVWAPCIRYHNNEFFIFFPDPDYGSYMIKAAEPRDLWTEPVLIKEGKGLIDPLFFGMMTARPAWLMHLPAAVPG